MTDLLAFCIGSALTGGGLFWAGYHFGGASMKAVMTSVGSGLKTDLTVAEQDLVALWRKHFAKATAPASLNVSGTGTPPAATAQAAPAAPQP